MSWSNYIKDDLKRKIRAGHELPEKLTLHGLSEQYDVSVTPVRLAMDELIEDGFLHKGDNGRLAINPERIGSDAPGAESARPEPPRNHYDQIANDLVILSLRGQPVLIREEDTAGRYGIGRTTVREVLNRLAGMGMLDHVPRRGWRLRPFRREDLDAFLEVREVLELKALELTWPRLADDRLKAIHDGNVLPKTSSERPIIDNSLHGYIIEMAANPYIRDFFERYGRYYEILFDWDTLHREVAIDTVQQHRQIIAAILRRDRRAAKKALVHHVRYNYGLNEVLLRDVPLACGRSDERYGKED